MILTKHKHTGGPLDMFLERLEKGISEIFQILQYQQESWQHFHNTPAGKRVTKRVWSRHGALLEQISRDRC